MKPTIALTFGDFNGIGPEVLLKSLSKGALDTFQPLLIGHESVFSYYNELFNYDLQFQQVKSPDLVTSSSLIPVLNVSDSKPADPIPGRSTPESGKFAMLAVEKAARLCMENKCHAMVTAPISKEAIRAGGYKVPGHTEFLTRLTGSKDSLMILAGATLKVAVVTGHIPLKEVAANIQVNRIARRLQLFIKSLKDEFGIPDPSIAVLGLNPHAGDGGVLGQEESKVIIPAIKQVLDKEVTRIEGPFPADGFFGSGSWKKYDGILAMYHDQGLIPFKTLTFGKGVNFTAGLPIIRSSPDHGTAFDIAGKNISSEESMSAAIQLAVQIAKRRNS